MNQELRDKIQELAMKRDIEGIRKLIKRNPQLNNCYTRELNEDFPMKQYRFVKRNGRLIIVHDNERNSNYQPEHEENNEINEIINKDKEVNEITNEVKENQNTELEKLKIQIETLNKRIDVMKEVINKMIQVLNKNNLMF